MYVCACRFMQLCLFLVILMCFIMIKDSFTTTKGPASWFGSTPSVYISFIHNNIMCCSVAAGRTGPAQCAAHHVACTVAGASSPVYIHTYFLMKHCIAGPSYGGINLCMLYQEPCYIYSYAPSLLLVLLAMTVVCVSYVFIPGNNVHYTNQ